MLTVTEQQIKEIAEQLDCGFRSFWHKPTGELLYIPDFNNDPFSVTEFYKDDLEKLDNNFSDYIEIEKPTSTNNFEIMANFTEQLNDNKALKSELINALNKKKPFREFKFVIDNAGVYRQQWFDFKHLQLKQWVSIKFSEATYDNRDYDSI